jgi:hypothetical protein
MFFWPRTAQPSTTETSRERNMNFNLTELGKTGVCKERHMTHQLVAAVRLGGVKWIARVPVQINKIMV